MTNETNEQKPEITMCKCGASYLDDQHPICPECMIEETTKMPPQEVEAKGWTYKPLENYFELFDPEGNSFAMVLTNRVAAEICDRFNELDRLRSSMGKVPSDAEIEKELVKIEKLNLKPSALILSTDFTSGAQWMRSEVAPVITGYAAREYILKCTSEVQKHTIALLRSELKQAKDALSKSNELMTQAHEFNLLYPKTLDDDLKCRVLCNNELLTPKKDESAK